MNGINGTVTFHTALFGYQKAEVDDYVARAESELDIQEKRQENWDTDIENQKKEIERLKNILEAERNEKQMLLDKQNRMQREMETIQEELFQSLKKMKALEKEYEDYRNKMEEEGTDPKIIQDAILSAQRMSDIVIGEAQQKAHDILDEAEQDKNQKAEEGRQIIENAQNKAKQATDTAEIKCVKLQKEYDRILLDVTGFKAELMKMYRKHMEMLAELPQKDIVEIEESSDTKGE